MSIEIRGLTITIGDKPIVRDACMDIADGERIGLVGSSGSGKSMIAKALMGLLPDTARVSGSIMAGGRQLIGLDDTAMADLRGRYMGMVFQNPAAALNPVMTVAQQIGLPLYLHYDLSLDERLDRVKAMLDKVGLSQDALLKYPHQLSGGQQQRVAFARAIAVKPGCILFDEPLSALDALLREEMRHELTELTSALGITSVFVTHHQTEAMSMSDRIAVLNGGCVEQYAAPETVYHAPATAFVARFVGKSNWLSETEMFRPEAAAQTPGKDALHFELPVRSVQYLGSSYEITVHYQTVTWTLHTGQKTKPGDTLSVYINPDQIITFQKKKEVLSA